MGAHSAKKTQLGQESPAGTEVDATTVYRGSVGLKDDLTLNFVDETVGVYAGGDYTYISKYGTVIPFDAAAANFQQVHYHFEAGLKAVGTGTADNGGSNFIYTYPIPTTTAPTIQTFTVEGGDDTQEEQALYAFCQDFTLSGSGGEALTVAANWYGRQLKTGTFTASVNIPVVEPILFGKGALAIDEPAGTHGNTPVTGTLMDMTLKVVTGVKVIRGADGTLDFGTINYVMPDITLDVTFLHNSNAVAEKAKWRAETVRLIQLLFLGSLFTTAGTVYTYHTLLIDLVGKWETFDILGEQDGNSIVTATFRNKYNSVDGAGQIVVSNELAALT